MSSPRANIGVFGGSGFYTYLEEAETRLVDTGWSDAPVAVTIGEVAGRQVAFLPRHGAHHQLPPHKVNYRANIDVMRQLGVSAVLAPFAAGSLRPSIQPGDFVVVDQLVDRTHGRADTFYDSFVDGPVHTSLADPYDEKLRALITSTGRDLGLTMHDHGTVVVIPGPRFSTRAESAWHRSMGWDLVNMTQYPEAALAREANLPYAGVALVTDYDTGIDDADAEPVDQDTVFATFENNLTRLRDLLAAVIRRVSV